MEKIDLLLHEVKFVQCFLKNEMKTQVEMWYGAP